MGELEVVYNASLVMMPNGEILPPILLTVPFVDDDAALRLVSFLSLVNNTYMLPPSGSWAVGNSLLRHTIGLPPIGLRVWAFLESYQALGVFG